ncbi:MAG: hypothetical protein K9J12_02870 [Melioribacteraceae bacterium]|nr:hypothetical protein [Melioribacteraceae bacterium]MCF8263321.1 hypothetical protein [Melioribacteraceae bacterium]MCF8413901.1 hypothetical protein [Melioribacteraceae bacterium]MCF8431983.1 hypothetical protein [Melioribacteraceae bacterium]
MRNLLFLFLLINSLVSAHDPNIAYFEFNVNDGQIVLKADFPWTLRNAILKDFPELQNSNSQGDFDEALFKYLEENISITADGELLTIFDVMEFPGNHSHGAAFEIIYKSKQTIEQLSIINSCMFNLYPNQKNYNTLIFDSGEIFETMTEIGNAEFSTASANRNYLYYILIFGIIVSGFILIYFYALKRK